MIFFKTNEAQSDNKKMDVRRVKNEKPNMQETIEPYTVCDIRFMAGNWSTTNKWFTTKLYTFFEYAQSSLIGKLPIGQINT